MAWRNEPRQLYRLADGSNGTEYEAVAETLKRREADLRALEEKIELLRRRLETAEGHP